jgi:3-deoxy-manno-octulosonate cytidylyltransferase (CMP-KDO synthetase)
MAIRKILGVIPARLGSTRLPRKVLRLIAGKPMVEWVWLAAVANGQMDEVVVATDSEEVGAFCQSAAIPFAMTSPDCASGSDRVHEVSRQIDAEIYVNIQGDSRQPRPLLLPFHHPPRPRQDRLHCLPQAPRPLRLPQTRP